MSELCPACLIEMDERNGQCAGEDEHCDCDQFWKCPKCATWWYRNCPAHKGTTWQNCKPLPPQPESNV